VAEALATEATGAPVGIEAAASTDAAPEAARAADEVAETPAEETPVTEAPVADNPVLASAQTEQTPGQGDANA